jgi:hypothetical protein
MLPISAFAQLDASALRAKYGEPLARETFRVRPHIEAVVNYGPGRQVCEIGLPPDNDLIMDGEANFSFLTKRQINEVIDELVPPSIRGKEIRRIGTHRLGGIFSTEYEHININEFQDPAHRGVRRAVTIHFNRPDCNK